MGNTLGTPIMAEGSAKLQVEKDIKEYPWLSKSMVIQMTSCGEAVCRKALSLGEFRFWGNKDV